MFMRMVRFCRSIRRRADELEELLIESVDDPSDLDHERVKALEYSQAGIRPHTFAEDYARDHKRIHSATNADPNPKMRANRNSDRVGCENAPGKRVLS